jgi:aromatase
MVPPTGEERAAQVSIASNGQPKQLTVDGLLSAVGVQLLAENVDSTFGDLGIDSLGRLEIAKTAHDEMELDIEDLLTDDMTPRGLGNLIAEMSARRPAGTVSSDMTRRRQPFRTENSVELEAPIGFVWDSLIDVRNWPALFTEYAAADVLSEGENWLTFRLTTHPDEQGQVWSWVSRRRWNRSTWTVRAWRIERGPFEFMRLVWRFEQLAPDRTRMTWLQEFRMRADAPVDGPTMRDQLNRGSVVQMNAIARRLLERRSAVRGWVDTRSVRTRGGDMRTILAPGTAGSAFGLTGLVELAPGERVNEHYHPYSEESLVLVQGQVEVDLDGRPSPLAPRQAVLVPRNMRHRVRNTGSTTALLVFALSPLAPRPDLGHVDTETSAALALPMAQLVGGGCCLGADGPCGCGPAAR